MINLIFKKAMPFFLVVIFLLFNLPLTSLGDENEGEAKGSSIIVSLGDSYSSGEGIEPFYSQSLPDYVKVKNLDWLAHRSENAWSGMLTLPSLDAPMSEYKDENWYFVAASGATTSNIGGIFRKTYYKKQLSQTIPVLRGTVSLPSQISVFDTLKLQGKSADYVTLTLGGNDVGFTDAVTAAVCSSTYLTPSYLRDKLNQTWENFYEGGIRENICAAYEQIHTGAGDEAKILVVGYPRLLDPDGSAVLFSEESSRMLNTAVSQFNDALEAIVNSYSLRGYNIYFVSVEDEFLGHGAYSDHPYINEVILGTKSQDINDTDLVSSYSMHPNYNGACAYAECVQAKIDELEGKASDSSNTKYNPDILLSVYDINNTLYGDYTIDITGTYNTGWFGWSWFGWFEKEYNNHFTVNDSSVQSVSLEPDGSYTITVTDNKDSSKTYSKSIEVSEEYANSRINFSTNFGEAAAYSSDEEADITFEQTDDILNPLPTRSTSDEREIVLVLDTSGSMSGTPIEETRKASENFINTILDEDACIGVVTYDSGASMISDFSVDKTWLSESVAGINSGGGTNIEAGLAKAREMLEASNAKKKIIVLMSDGEPNQGKEGDELISYADEIKNDSTIIYTLGFFESLGGHKSSAQTLMEKIASDGCHYEVADADDLIFFFEDMADQINGQKYIYVRIACPVDVTVTYNGETLCSAEDRLTTRTDFGTLTFEDNENVTDPDEDDRIKVLRLKEGEKYDVQIVGTGHGIMDYTIGFMDENGDYSDFRRFENIKITRSTVIDTVAAVSNESILNIDQDGDGKYDLRLRAGENGYGEEFSSHWLIYAAAGGAVLLLLIIILLIIIKKRTNKNAKEIK